MTTAQTIDPGAAALGAEVLAIVARAHTSVVAAVGALAAGEQQTAQAALDRVIALAQHTMVEKNRFVPVRDLFAAIDGRNLPAAATSVGGS